MEKKELICEALEGKRYESVLDLIRTTTEIGEFKIPQETLNEIKMQEPEIEDEERRYILIEEYNLHEGFFCRFYYDGSSDEEMYADYFEECDNATEIILVIDMVENMAYNLTRNINYNVTPR